MVTSKYASAVSNAWVYVKKKKTCLAFSDKVLKHAKVNNNNNVHVSTLFMGGNK